MTRPTKTVLEAQAEGLNLGQAMMAAQMSEATLQEHVRTTCKALGVKHMHQWSSKHSTPGWPDSYMVGPAGTLVRELKVQDLRRGATSEAQDDWLSALSDQGLDVGVWRPADWLNGTIQADILLLSGRRKAA